MSRVKLSLICALEKAGVYSVGAQQRKQLCLSSRSDNVVSKLKILNMGDYNNEAYPVGALKPKAETKALSFLQKFPNFNGDGVNIAILDSGVDPWSSGLQVSTFSLSKCCP